MMWGRGRRSCQSRTSRRVCSQVRKGSEKRAPWGCDLAAHRLGPTDTKRIRPDAKPREVANAFRLATTPRVSLRADQVPEESPTALTRC